MTKTYNSKLWEQSACIVSLMFYSGYTFDVFGLVYNRQR